MSIASGYKKFKKYILTSSGFQLVSHWTKANTLEFDDGKTAQDKSGAIDGISSSRESNSDKIAASTALVSELNSDLTALNDAGAIQGMEVREGDGIYITYTDGADTVIKKLVNGIIDLGTGTAFNISNRTSNYKNLTINDFIIEVNSFSVGSSSYYKGTGNCWPGGYFTLVKSYNAATGILTAYGHLKGGYSTSTAGVEGWVEKTSSCHAYLIDN